jgi:hypothetical protein
MHQNLVNKNQRVFVTILQTKSIHVILNVYHHLGAVYFFISSLNIHILSLFIQKNSIPILTMSKA